jgi:hypothetical protein
MLETIITLHMCSRTSKITKDDGAMFAQALLDPWHIVRQPSTFIIAMQAPISSLPSNTCVDVQRRTMQLSHRPSTGRSQAPTSTGTPLHHQHVAVQHGSHEPRALLASQARHEANGSRRETERRRDGEMMRRRMRKMSEGITGRVSKTQCVGLGFTTLADITP